MSLTGENRLMQDVAGGNLDFLFFKHPRPMWVFDLDSLEFLAVNDAACRLYGYDPDEFLTKTLADIRPADAMHELALAAEGARSNKADRRSGPFRHCHADGSEFTVEVESTFMTFEGRSARLVMIVDLTDKLSAQQTLHERESQIRLFVDQLPAIMWTTDTELQFTSLAGAALGRIGILPASGLGKRVDEVFSNADDGKPSSVPPAHAAALLGNRVRYGGWWNDRYFDSVVEPLYDRARTIVGVIGVSLDVTDQHEDRRELEARTEELHAAQAIAHFGSWSMDLRTGNVHWSPELYRIVGEHPENTELERSLFLYDHPDDTEAVRNAIATAERKHESYDIEHRIVRKDETVRVVREQGAFDFDAAGRAIRCVGTVLDITEQKSAEDRLAYLAHHDPLTNLPNRTLLQERLMRAVVHAERRSANTAVLFLDLDRFKYINDTFGHVIGDELLVQVGERLTNVLRAGDTVARPGGDEFVVVLEDLEDLDTASDLAQRIRAEFARPFDLTVGPQFISASIGIALYPHDGLTPNDLLRSADSAMYRAKERGGNDFQFFTPQLHEAAMRQLELGNALRVAIERHDVYAVYQPINRTSDGRVVGVEALARWNRGELTPVGPQDFVRVAEESGIIRELGELIMREACQQMAEWLAAGVALDYVAVNISPRQLAERGFVSRVAEILVATRLAPHRLELEITETGFVDGNDEAFAAITQLRQLGIRFAIDDFGTGYSSLAYLKRIPADTIKIDRSFIVDLSASSDRAIVEAVVMVARNLGKRVVAEGIEGREQLNYLQKLGCEFAQGYFFSMPTDAASIVKLTRTTR